MNKMNKKGFTLIEMLVVIAIIAVLVSIIIPTIAAATDKAAAPTNAANLRSLKAEIVTAYLTGGNEKWKFTEAGALDTANSTGDDTANLPSFKGAGSFEVTGSKGDFTVKFGGKTIADWAKDAS